MTSTTARRPSAPAPTRPRGRSRLGTLARRPVVAASAVALVVAGAGAAAGTDTFQVFRTDGVTPVELRADDLVSLPDLHGLGEVRVSGEPEPHQVGDARDAETETGLRVPVVVELPDGLSGPPAYQVAGPVTATVRLDADRAAAADLPALPDQLDGATVRVDAGPGVAQLWTSSSSGIPRLVVATALAPTVSSDDADLEEVRGYLLRLPGVSDELAAQLDDLSLADGTLPVPVPRGLAEASSADVGGVPATVLESPDRALAAVVWVVDGTVTVVAGSASGEEVLEVARGLE